MSLISIFTTNFTALAEQWADTADEIYPFASIGFIRSRQDPIANPVGGRTKVVSELLLSAILAPPADPASVDHGLTEFMRVRAIQDIPPELAVAPVFAYKKIFRDHLATHRILLSWKRREELSTLDAAIDALALRAFGLYTLCRNDYYEAKIADIQRRHSQVLRFAQRYSFEPSSKDIDTI